MGCSGRSKYDDMRPEQKWDFIVGSILTGGLIYWLLTVMTEFKRLQIDFLLRVLRIWLSLAFTVDLNCCLRGGYLYCSEFAGIR
jgi:hypothetical protein